MDSSSPNQGRSRGGHNRNRNRNHNRSGKPRQPEPEPTLKDKVLGFLGLGKKPGPGSQGEPRKPSGPDRSTGAQARKRVQKAQQKSQPRQKKKREPAPVTNTRLHVGNLNYDATGEDLENLFKDSGTVVSAEIVTNPHSGRSKGFGFVEMGSVDEAKAVAEKFHGQDLMGRDLVISGAKSQGPRESGEGGRRRERKPGRGRDRDRQDRRDETGDPAESRAPHRKSRAERLARSRDGAGDSGESTTPAEPVSSARLKIENLDTAILPGDLLGLFQGIGRILSSEVADGTATVDVGSLDEARRAVEILNGKQFMGRQIKVTSIEDNSSEPETAAAPAEDEETPPETPESPGNEEQPAAASEPEPQPQPEPEPESSAPAVEAAVAESSAPATEEPAVPATEPEAAEPAADETGSGPAEPEPEPEPAQPESEGDSEERT